MSEGVLGDLGKKVVDTVTGRKDKTFVYIENPNRSKTSLKNKDGTTMTVSDFEELPHGYVVRGSLDMSQLPGDKIPDGLQVTGDLTLPKGVRKLPSGLKVGGTLGLNKRISELPSGLEVGRLLLNDLVKYIPDDLKAKSILLGMAGKPLEDVPVHLQNKVVDRYTKKNKFGFKVNDVS